MAPHGLIHLVLESPNKRLILTAIVSSLAVVPCDLKVLTHPLWVGRLGCHST